MKAVGFVLHANRTPTLALSSNGAARRLQRSKGAQNPEGMKYRARHSPHIHRLAI
jgi:hypothetical protein